MKKITEKSEKRQKILIAARALFNRTHDVKRVSLEAIAEEASVSPTTIYNNFGDRETLVSEVIKELIGRTLERNRAIVNSDLPFPQKIVGVIRGKMNIASQVDDEIIEKLITQDKSIAPFFNEIYEKEIKPLWMKVMADGRKEGYVDPALDDAAIIAYLDIVQAGLKAKPDYLKHFTSNISLIQQFLRLFFYGFLKKDIDLFQKEEK